MAKPKFCIDRRGQIIRVKDGRVVGHAYLTCDISPATAKMHEGGFDAAPDPEPEE